MPNKYFDEMRLSANNCSVNLLSLFLKHVNTYNTKKIIQFSLSTIIKETLKDYKHILLFKSMAENIT